MVNESRYYFDNSFKDNDDEKWFFLIRKVLDESDYVEFNILRKNYKRVPEISILSEYMIKKGKKKNKIFVSGDYIRYSLNNEVKKFILSKKYIDWYNYYLEDISFLKADKEILATMSHENYVVMLLTEDQKNELNKLGYSFGFFMSPDDLL